MRMPRNEPAIHSGKVAAAIGGGWIGAVGAAR